MTEEVRAIVSRAPSGGCNSTESCGVGLLQESIPEIQVPGSRPFRRQAAANHDFRSNFIARAAYAHAAMHYYLRCVRRSRGQ
jgi:hypothetical protein